MTTSETHLAEAEREMSRVVTEPDLLAWHEAHMNSFDYLNLSQEAAREMEELYLRKAAWFMGVMAG